jgi:enoyl-CoA hydratase/carnithine racemase
MSSVPDPLPTLPDSLCANRDGDIAILRIDRAGKRNALNDELILGVGAFFSSLPADVRAVVIHGAGKHFCAGLDLSELQERDAFEGVAHSRMWHRALDAVQFGRVPVVAVMHGAVVGGGLELASAAHLRVAETSTFYALPEGRRGIFLGGGGSVRITRLIGAARLTDMMLTERVFTAEEGQQMALSQYLVGAGDGLAKGIELARKIAANAAVTNFALMHVLPRIAEVGQDQGLITEALIAAVAQSMPEAKERIRQFLGKQAGTRVEAPK